MRNHDQKVLDMARGALAGGNGRRAARRLRRLSHHHDRARLRQALHQLQRCTDPDDFEGDVTFDDFDSWIDFVWARQSNEYLSGLVRWAEVRITEAFPDRDADAGGLWAFVTTLLPDTVAGRHARDHILWRYGITNHGDNWAEDPLAPEDDAEETFG